MDISRVNVGDIFDEPLQKFWVDFFETLSPLKKGGRVQKPTYDHIDAFIWNHPKSSIRNEMVPKSYALLEPSKIIRF